MSLSVKLINRGSKKGIEKKTSFDVHKKKQDFGSPPPPPPVHELLPKPTSTKDEIQLNIDVPSMFKKINMTVHVKEM